MSMKQDLGCSQRWTHRSLLLQNLRAVTAHMSALSSLILTIISRMNTRCATTLELPLSYVVEVKKLLVVVHFPSDAVHRSDSRMHDLFLSGAGGSTNMFNSPEKSNSGAHPIFDQCHVYSTARHIAQRVSSEERCSYTRETKQSVPDRRGYFSRRPNTIGRYQLARLDSRVGFTPESTLGW